MPACAKLNSLEQNTQGLARDVIYYLCPALFADTIIALFCSSSKVSQCCLQLFAFICSLTNTLLNTSTHPACIESVRHKHPTYFAKGCDLSFEEYTMLFLKEFLTQMHPFLTIKTAHYFNPIHICNNVPSYQRYYHHPYSVVTATELWHEVMIQLNTKYTQGFLYTLFPPYYLSGGHDNTKGVVLLKSLYHSPSCSNPSPLLWFQPWFTLSFLLVDLLFDVLLACFLFCCTPPNLLLSMTSDISSGVFSLAI